MAEGIRARHARFCRHASGKCNCTPSFEAFVYSRRDDKKIRRSFSGKGALAAAKAWRVDAGNALNRGRLRAPTQTTLREAAEEWLEGAKSGAIPNRAGQRYKPAAWRGYERSLNLRILPELGGMRLSAIARADVQDFADKLTSEGLSASTVQNTLDPLRVIFRRAIRRDVIAVDPTENLELRRPDGRRDRIARPDEAAALLNALPDEERALWATAMYAGLRRGELRALRWSDVDLAAEPAVIHVRRTWDDSEGELDDTKTDAGRRVVPLIAKLRVLLAEHGLRTTRAGDDLVFGRTAADPFTPT